MSSHLEYLTSVMLSWIRHCNGVGPLVESALQNVCCSGVNLEIKESKVVAET